MANPERRSSRERVAAVASRLGHGLPELATDIREVIETSVPVLREDDGRSLLEASIQSCIEAALNMLAGGADPAVLKAPRAAIEYARHLAQRGVSRTALARAGRIGLRRSLHRLIEELIRDNNGSEVGRATLEMVDQMCDYLDRVEEQLLIAYAESRKEWTNPEAVLAEHVRSVLNETEMDLDSAQARLGTYALRQQHLGAKLWVSPNAGAEGLALLRRLSDALAAAAHCRNPALFVPIDTSSASTWLPLGAKRAVDLDAFAGAMAATPTAYAAFGKVNASLAGFRRTHQQATGAETVARINVPPLKHLTPYGEVAPIVMLSANLASTRPWIAETLGALAIDDARHELLRETTRVFFATGSSFTAAAKRLSLHRNTVQYRVRAAEEIRGRPFRESRLDVELALLACRWLGSAVLVPPGRQGRAPADAIA